jgi:hypothetical protein
MDVIKVPAQSPIGDASESKKVLSDLIRGQ